MKSPEKKENLGVPSPLGKEPCALPDGLTLEQVLRYLGRREQDLITMRQALDSGDLKPIRDLAHKIKGNAALYGLPEFGLAAGRLLVACEGEDRPTIEDSFQKLEKELRTGKERYLQPQQKFE